MSARTPHRRTVYLFCWAADAEHETGFVVDELAKEGWRAQPKPHRMYPWLRLMVRPIPKL
jgi:hypothetical protein